MKELVALPPELPDHGILPGFGPRSTQRDKGHVGVKVPAASLEKLIVKIVKGITYVIDGRLLDENYTIDHYFLRDEDATDIQAMLDKYASKFERGPGVTVQRAVPYDEPAAAHFLIEIWGRLKFHAIVMPKSLEDDRRFKKPKTKFIGHLKYPPPLR